MALRKDGVGGFSMTRVRSCTFLRRLCRVSVVCETRKRMASRLEVRQNDRAMSEPLNMPEERRLFALATCGPTLGDDLVRYVGAGLLPLGRTGNAGGQWAL